VDSLAIGRLILSTGLAQRLDRVDVRLYDGAVVVLGLYQTVFHHDYVVR
jgi:hypothetical protein